MFDHIEMAIATGRVSLFIYPEVPGRAEGPELARFFPLNFSIASAVR